MYWRRTQKACVRACVRASQLSVDGSAVDWRRGRAASGNNMPSSTSLCTGRAGKLTAMAFSVPTIEVSAEDLITGLQEGLPAFQSFCTQLARESDPVARFGTFDAKAAITLDAGSVLHLVRCEREWGYSCRVVDLIKLMATVGKKSKKKIKKIAK